MAAPLGFGFDWVGQGTAWQSLRLAYTARLLRGESRRGSLRKHRSGGLRRGIGLNDLPRLRLGKAQLARHPVNALRLRQLRFAEAQLPVVFPQLIQNLLLRLDAIAAFDGAEVLQSINHRQQKKNRDGRGKERI